jgi:hydroxymethylpyrimidine pyrophosphatase-like HAD family hydrolase
MKAKNEIIQKMQEENKKYLNQLNALEKTYPAMKLSFQAWNIYWEIDDAAQNIHTCFLNNEFETNCVESYLSCIDDMIFDTGEQLRELTNQLKNDIDQLNSELGWTYRM